MKHYLGPVFVFAAMAVLACASVQAETGEKMVIAVATDDFELTETDISTLAVGEAQTIETDDGKIIDILRTADGAEIYVDGELLEMNFSDDDPREEHSISKHVEVTCDDDGDCHKNVVFLKGDESDSQHWVAADGENIVIHKEIERVCSDDDEGNSCADHVLWVSGDEDTSTEKLLEEHKNSDGHKVIVIKKVQVTKD